MLGHRDADAQLVSVRYSVQQTKKPNEKKPVTNGSIKIIPIADKVVEKRRYRHIWRHPEDHIATVVLDKPVTAPKPSRPADV